LLDGSEEPVVPEILAGGDPPTEQDEALLRRLDASFDEQKVLNVLGAERFKFGAHGIELLRRYLFSASLQVLPRSQVAGDIIPTEAGAEIVMRLPPGMDPTDSVEAVRRFLAAKGFGDLEVRQIVGYPGSRTRLAEPVVQSLIAAYRYHRVEPQIWPLLASATPFYLFDQVLGIPYAWGGLGKAGRSHSADEYASIDGLKEFERSVTTFLHEFGAYAAV
jgi:acetylornithine deacetylase/succinyl-diaminopimelate desuccinylase-like protein